MRKNYKPVAEITSAIYFTVLKLEKLDVMYKFSLDFFVRIFKKSIKIAEKPPNKKVQLRVGYIIDSIKKCIYYEMNRSIFVKHKIFFSFILAITDLEVKN